MNSTMIEDERLNQEAYRRIFFDPETKISTNEDNEMFIEVGEGSGLPPGKYQVSIGPKEHFTNEEKQQILRA